MTAISPLLFEIDTILQFQAQKLCCVSSNVLAHLPILFCYTNNVKKIFETQYYLLCGFYCLTHHHQGGCVLVMTFYKKSNTLIFIRDLVFE